MIVLCVSPSLKSQSELKRHKPTRTVRTVQLQTHAIVEKKDVRVMTRTDAPPPPHTHTRHTHGHTRAERRAEGEREREFKRYTVHSTIQPYMLTSPLTQDHRNRCLQVTLQDSWSSTGPGMSKVKRGLQSRRGRLSPRCRRRYANCPHRHGQQRHQKEVSFTFSHQVHLDGTVGR